MRTTLDIDEDILNAAKELATRQKVSAGKVLSDLARKALVEGSAGPTKRSKSGFAMIPDHGQVITVEFVERLLNETE